MDPRLRAEVRGVEEGHHVFLHTSDPLVYRVLSDSEPGLVYYIQAHAGAGVWAFTCTCEAGQRKQMCKHSQLVARRLEREGRATLDPVTNLWEAEFTVDPDDDPFQGL